MHGEHEAATPHSHVFLDPSHEESERRTWMVIGLCAAMMAAEIVGGLLFGSITASDVAEAVAEQAKITLDRRKLRLDEPIKSLGTHEVPVKLHSDVEFRVTVEVVRQ